MKNIRTLFAVVCGFLVMAAGAHANVQVGEAAPDFTLTDIQGNEHTLSDYAGRFIILEWINYDCPFVKKFYEPGKMQEWQTKMRHSGVVWLSIDSTNPDHSTFRTQQQHQEIVREWGIRSTAVLPDPDGAVGRKYNARNTPHMFIIDPEGKLRYQGAIDSIRSADSDDIEKADNYVLQSMARLLEQQPVENPQTRPYGCTVHYAKKTKAEE